MRQPGLLLPPVIADLGSEQEQQIQQNWETIDNVELDVSRAGISPIPKPQHMCPSLTHEMLMATANDKYTENMLMIKAWKDYVEERYGRIKARQLEVENEMAEIARGIRLSIMSQQTDKKTKDPGYAKKDRIPDLIASNPRYVDLKLKLQTLKQEELVLEPRLSALSGDLRIISRTVELRRQEWEEGRSNMNQPLRRPLPSRL
jgi:hypothetical protein